MQNAIQHKVSAGETVSSIAKRFNVPTSAVQGFRSNDPNVIFPDETLTIDTTQAQTPVAPGQQTPVVDGSALQATGGQNLATPTPQAPTPEESTVGITPVVSEPPADAGQGAITESLKQSEPKEPAPTTQPTGAPTELPAPETQPTVAEPTTDIPTFEQALEEAGLDSAEVSPGVFRTMSGAEVDAQGNLINPPEQQADEALGQFGISGDAVAQGFQTNPFGTIADIAQQVMQATGLPDVREQVSNTANEIEQLELERDKEIARIQDDPFSSVSSKAQRAQNISDQYDKRINARINKLTLLQGAQQDARQQAQFAVNAAIGIFGKQQEFQQQQVQDILDREEKLAEASAKLDEPLSVSEAKALGVPFGTTQREAFGITPVDASKEALTAAQRVSEIKVEPNQPETFKNMLRASSGGKPPVAGERGSLTKAFLVVDQIDTLTTLTESEATGPVSGIIRSNNPYDSKAQQIKAQLTQIVPNLARGVFGEVGVLTDADVALYSKTLPNLTNPTDIRDAIAGLTLKTVQRSIENQLEVLAASGIDVSGFENKYNRLTKTISGIEERLDIGLANTPTEDEAIFDEVVETQGGGNYLQNLWGALVGA